MNDVLGVFNNNNLEYLEKTFGCFIFPLQNDRPDGYTAIYSASDNSRYPCFISVKTEKDPIGENKLISYLEAIHPDKMYTNRKEDWNNYYNSIKFANGFLRIIFSSVGGFTYKSYQMVKEYNLTDIGKKFPIILLCAPTSFLEEELWKNFALLQKNSKVKYAKNYEKNEEDLEKLSVPIPNISNLQVMNYNVVNYGEDFEEMNLEDPNEIYYGDL